MRYLGPAGGHPKQLTEKEWLEYRARRASYLEAHPDYDLGWNRPVIGTASRLWAALAAGMRPHRGAPLGLSIDHLLPNLQTHPWLTLEDDLAIAPHPMQALVAAIDAVLASAEIHLDSDGEPVGGTFTTNDIFDAVADGWSDNYRKARAVARSSWEMSRETLVSSWRDLQRLGVQFEPLLRAVQQGCDGLYETRHTGRSYRVIVNYDSDLWTTFIRALDDPQSGYRRRGSHPRLLRADSEPQPHRRQADVAADWEYNVVVSGPRGLALIERLQRARLYFDMAAFEEDYERMRAEKLSAEDADASRARVSAMRPIHDDIAPLARPGRYISIDSGAFAPSSNADYVKIRSGFFKGVNRRFYPDHFWPVEVTSKDMQTGQTRVVETALGAVQTSVSWSRRARWFRAEAAGLSRDWIGNRLPLAGVDISASQIQVLAVFLGLSELELAATQRPFKEVVAERAWQLHNDPSSGFRLPEPDDTAPFEGPHDPLLQSAAKQATMTALYGSEYREVARKLDPMQLPAYMREGVRGKARLARARETYGPGLGTYKNLKILLTDEVLGLSGIFGPVGGIGFLPACQKLASIATKIDPFGGVTFTDPYDEAEVRWNPIRLDIPTWHERRKPVAGTGSVRLYANLPANPKQKNGDYIVDSAKLRSMVAPCLTHMMDAMFAALVVEILQDHWGVRDVVSVHDCWMVPADAEDALWDSIRRAGEPWLRSLGPIYDRLIEYFESAEYGDPDHAAWARDIRARWSQRVLDANWPEFRGGTAPLVSVRGGLIAV